MKDDSLIAYESKNQKDLILTKKIHNIKNFLFVISGYISIGEYTKAIEKISELCDSLVIDDNPVITGNPTIDLFLQNKYIIAKKHNIEFSYQNNILHKFKNNFSISEVDFCIALGNALDNAIEACLNLNPTIDRIININFSYVPNNPNSIFIEVSNPIEKTVPIINNLIKSAKLDSSMHGFGIASMKEIAEKYNGKVEFRQEENIFYIKLVFKD